MPEVNVPLFVIPPFKVIASLIELFQVAPLAIVTSPVNVSVPVVEVMVRFPLVPFPTLVTPVTVNEYAPMLKVAPSPIFKSPFIVNVAAIVVVPALQVKLLKLVKTVVGSVLFPANITVPVLGVQVLVPVPATVIAPFIVNVLLFVIVNEPGALLVPFPRIKLPATKLDPLTNVIVPELVVEFEPPI